MLTWKHQVTTSKRSVFLLAPSALLTDETGFGLLPTTRAQDGEKGTSVAQVVGRRVKRKGTGDMRGMDLGTRIGLLPTPNAQVSNDGETPETWLKRAEEIKAKGINGNGAGMPLAIAVQLLPTMTAREHKGGRDPATLAAKGRKANNTLSDTLTAMLPTPTTGDAKDRGWQWNGSRTKKVMSLPGTITEHAGKSQRSKLQPGFAAWMMGFPEDWTVSPFQRGEDFACSPSAKRAAAGAAKA